MWVSISESFPGGSDGKEPACNAGDLGSIPGSGISLGEGNGNPLQYSCLENPLDRRAWWATVHGVTKSQTQLSNKHNTTISDELSPNGKKLPTVVPAFCYKCIKENQLVGQL